MSSIRRRIRRLMQKKKAPAFLFSFYFKKQLRGKQQYLGSLLESGKDLLANLGEEERQHWEDRINDVLQCADNQDIPRHPQAGKIEGENLVMQNGLLINPLSYYSLPMLKMLMLNKGVHEPQEEKIFQEVLRSLDPTTSRTMLELGSYWSFYSMWFKKWSPVSQCFMVEPDRNNLFYGKLNLDINQLSGTFIHAGIGKQSDRQNNILTVDDICTQNTISFIDVLHADIQGFELEMLYGSNRMFSEQKVGYVFVSTHSNELHQACFNLLHEDYGFTLVASADLQQTFSWDGILVMKAPDYPGVNQVEISKKNKLSV